MIYLWVTGVGGIQAEEWHISLKKHNNATCLAVKLQELLVQLDHECASAQHRGTEEGQSSAWRALHDMGINDSTQWQAMLMSKHLSDTTFVQVPL